MSLKKKLIKKQYAHLRETIEGRVTLAAFKLNREHHKKMKEKSGHEPCYECREIALRLGVEA